jgi:undecaprenyl-phosphate 4-deoxy-4-formamido-L-arabinose transferase
MVSKESVNAASGVEPPEFSAVITCYYEEQTIETFHARLSSALESLGRTYEIIFVNDGSTDKTFDKIRAIFEKDPRVSVAIDLFRNAGQGAAITAGICEARGKAFILMDSDLQLAPEELPTLVQEFDKGFDLVTGYRRDRRDSFFRKFPSKIANVIMRRASRSNIRDFGCTFKIYDARLLRAFEPGPHRIFSNVDLISKCQRLCEVPVSHFPRPVGKSGYTFAKLWQYNTDNLVVLSERPFQYLAAGCLLLAALLILRVLMGFFTGFKVLSEVSPGMILNAIAVSLLITLGSLSILGEYVIRIFMMLRKIPRYIIRDRLRR